MKSDAPPSAPDPVKETPAADARLRVTAPITPASGETLTVATEKRAFSVVPRRLIFSSLAYLLVIGAPLLSLFVLPMIGFHAEPRGWDGP